MEKSQNVGTKIAFTPLKYGILGQIFLILQQLKPSPTKEK